MKFIPILGELCLFSISHLGSQIYFPKRFCFDVVIWMSVSPKKRWRLVEKREKVRERSAERESEQTVKISLPFQIAAWKLSLNPVIRARCAIRFLALWVGASCCQVGRKTSSSALCHVCVTKETKCVRDPREHRS